MDLSLSLSLDKGSVFFLELLAGEEDSELCSGLLLEHSKVLIIGCYWNFLSLGRLGWKSSYLVVIHLVPPQLFVAIHG